MNKKHGFLSALAMLLMLNSLYYGGKVRQYDHSMSVKYDSGGLTAAQIDQINRGLNEEQEEELPYVTGYLKEKEVVVENKRIGRSMSLTMVSVYGEMSEVFPAPLYRGSFVQKADELGCVVSVTAAEHLFGNKSVVGCTLFVRGEAYTIRGIVKEKEALLLLQEKGNGKFPCLELSYERDDYPASNTKALLLRLGLPDYDSFSEGNLYGGIAGIFMGLPFLVLVLFMSGNILQKRNGGEKDIWYYLQCLLLFILFVLFLFLMAREFVSFSEDYIPAQISDFQFWPDLLQRIKEDYRSVLLYQTWGKEKQIIENLRGCIVASCLSVCFFSTINCIKQK